MADQSRFSRWLILSSSLILYFFLGYQISRNEFLPLVAIFGALFIGYGLAYRSFKQQDFWFWLAAGGLLRLVFVVSTPVLSDDVFRFIWDGRVLLNGLNPFEFVPSDLVGTKENLNRELFGLLNSQDRPTIYPPISQFVFYVSAWLSPNNIIGSIVIQRVVLLLGEVGLVVATMKLLKLYGLQRQRILLYVLNPLVIVEISGNLHFEGLMVFFLFLGILHLHAKRHWLASLAWGLSVGVKLLPLMFLPMLLRRLGIRKWLIFAAITGIVSILLFSPVLSLTFYQGFKEALLLYFQKFEFNASIYYLVREVGFWQKGWNMIAIIGPRLALTTFLLIIGYSWFENKRPVSLFEGMMWILMIYFSLALIVHPWYIVTILAVSIFTKWRWPIIWSFLILLSYEGYHEDGYTVNFWLIMLEYGLLVGFMIYEAFFRDNVRLWHTQNE